MNDSTENHIDILIERIASCQSRGDVFFPEGIFPSYRQNKYLFYKRPDTNIFYTATIIFILNQIKHKVSEKSQDSIELITEKAIKNYSDFQNKDGLKTYNFWQTKPTNHFPNGLIFKYLDHFRIPDDIDDTALIYLTLPHTKADVVWLKEKLKLHTPPPTPKGELKKSSPLGAGATDASGYSTWFGKNMPIEHDVCALCNLMYLFEKHQLPHNDYDESVFVFLRETILQEKYITNAFEVAHNYATTPLIIYHYARLLGDFKIPQLEICREKLILKTIQLLSGRYAAAGEPHNEKVTMNMVLLEIALMKLGGDRNVVKITQNSELRIQNFHFFIAGLLSSYKNPILYYFASMKITQMEWKCEAHDLALLVERTVATVAFCSLITKGELKVRPTF